MPSTAFMTWIGPRLRQLDEIADAHATVGGTARGRRHATSQINAAYATLLSSQFQGFCRDLHTEAAQQLVASASAALRSTFLLALTSSRKLDIGNPNAGNIGSDFKKLGLEFWPDVSAHGDYRKRQQDDLDLCMLWRNAIAHQDFSRRELAGRTAVLLKEVRDWRASLERLAPIFDEVVRAHLQDVLGSSPW